MTAFIQENIATIITILILTVVIFSAIIRIIRDKKKGIGPCGKNCSECRGCPNHK